MSERDERPVLPAGSAGDSDAAWGERSARDDDERLLDELPPHHVDRD